MTNKQETDQNLSILSALLYLRSELREGGFDQVESLISYASYVFLKSLKRK